VTVVERGAQHGTQILIRQVESHLTTVRPDLTDADRDLAEQLASSLREIVIETTFASAADRARVRAAVHCFVLRRDGRGPLPPVRSLAAARRVVNRVVRHLGRPDLLVGSEEDSADADPDVSAG
jgi:hypothetical protein